MFVILLLRPGATLRGWPVVKIQQLTITSFSLISSSSSSASPVLLPEHCVPFRWCGGAARPPVGRPRCHKTPSLTEQGWTSQRFPAVLNPGSCRRETNSCRQPSPPHISSTPTARWRRRDKRWEAADTEQEAPELRLLGGGGGGGGGGVEGGGSSLRKGCGTSWSQSMKGVTVTPQDWE